MTPISKAATRSEPVAAHGALREDDCHGGIAEIGLVTTATTRVTSPKSRQGHWWHSPVFCSTKSGPNTMEAPRRSYFIAYTPKLFHFADPANGLYNCGEPLLRDGELTPSSAGCK